MRSCIGVRSCASSTIRWPCGRSGPSSSARASSSERQVGVAPALAAAGLEQPLLRRRRGCRPLPRRAASGLVSSRRTSCSGFGRGQSASSVRFRKPPVRSAASMSSNEWYAATPSRARVALVERRARASSAGARGRPRGSAASACASSSERGDLLGREPELDPFEPDGEQLGRAAAGSARDRGGDHVGEPVVALQARERRRPRAATGSTPASSSTARCSTRSSPSIGRTCEM